MSNRKLMINFNPAPSHDSDLLFSFFSLLCLEGSYVNCIFITLDYIMEGSPLPPHKSHSVNLKIQIPNFQDEVLTLF